ncbi:hypothetical protein STRAU_4231 [Streptomyces aurantiacus JA 4570]|uniref:Uncharacterized protein n=1 Tax=Streptomyces aurantiacus JA 4570 TaxID=1286094 RepID=S3ZHW8_9ACTN|nr:hypothetical protein STRAU_4231 [Streptomyces aurantiacus JA 4570]
MAEWTVCAGQLARTERAPAQLAKALPLLAA